MTEHKKYSKEEIIFMKKIIFLFLFFLCTGIHAQDKIEITESDYTNTKVEMADKFREDGKIYVVIAIFAIVLGGFLIYTIRIDNKVSKLEKKWQAKNIDKEIPE